MSERNDDPKRGVVIYYKYKALLEKLPREERGDILMAAILFDETGEVTVFENPAADMLFSFLMLDLKALREAYEKQRAINSENGKKGGRPPKTETTGRFPEKQPDLSESDESEKSHNDNDKEKGNDNDNDNDKGKASPDLPPEDKVTFETFCKKTSEEWKALGLTPEFRYTTSAGLTPSERSSLWPAWERWSLREAIEAERNLARVRNSPDHQDKADGYKYPGFMAGGVGAYLDSANPLETFRIGGTPPDDPLERLAREAAERAAGRMKA